MENRVVLAGASGLIGSAVLPLLVQAGFDVHALMRREISEIQGVTSHISPTEQWPQIVSEIGADIAISCLGTTMQIAGSQSAFAAVDLDLVTAIAAAAKASEARQFISVSSIGANAKSRNFYLNTKGQMETAIRDMGFEQTDFLRPSLLRGSRGGQWRIGEQLGILLSPLSDMLLIGSLRRYRSIAAADVAAAVCALAQTTNPGSHNHENEAIVALALDSE